MNLGIFRTKRTTLDPGCSRATRNWPPLSSLGHQAPLALPFHNRWEVPSLCEESRVGGSLFFLLSTRKQEQFALLLVYTLPWRLGNGKKKPTLFCWPRDIFQVWASSWLSALLKYEVTLRTDQNLTNISGAYPLTIPCAKSQGAPR